MRNQRAGQATFIPLDTIQVKPTNDKLRSLGSGSRLAIDVIKYDPVLERAFQHACGSALVCDTVEIAKDRAYNKGVQVKSEHGAAGAFILLTHYTRFSRDFAGYRAP